MSIQKLKDRHEGMMTDLIYKGMTPGEICEKWDITPSRFSIIQQSPIWKAKAEDMRKIRDELSKQALESGMVKLAELRSPAIDKMKECLESDNENIKFASAKDILNRTGLSGDSEEKNAFKPIINMFIPAKWKGVEDEEAVDITKMAVESQ